jgi:DNA-binding GntR family transcriptional regulator
MKDESANKFLLIHSKNIQSLREVVVTSLREAIVTGYFKPGDHLKERELSEIMGVSTTPIKEAFRILGHEGLVVTVSRKGTFVSEMAETSIHEVQMLRAVVEGLSAKLAALKMTEEKLVELNNQVQLMEKLRDNNEIDQLIEENTTFHQMIIKIADSPMVSKILDNLSNFDKAFRKRALEQKVEIQKGFEEHREIFDAIKSQDGQLAENVMKQHIMRTVTDVLKENYKKGE